MMLIGEYLGGYGALDAMSIVLLRRFLDPLATLAPIVLIAVAAAALLGWTRSRPVVFRQTPDAADIIPRHRRVDAFVLILVLWGALLILAPDYFYLKDFFSSRINTVFKFYFQGWAFLSLAAAYGVYRIFQRVMDKSEENTARWAYSAIGAIFVLAALLVGSLYFPLAVRTKTNDSKMYGPPTLDASAFMQRQHPEDAAAIAWMIANIIDDGPIAEAKGNDYDSYAARVATFTGISNFIGWTFHEAQWRGGFSFSLEREKILDELYRTTDWTRALEILEKYEIRYVYFGPLEQSSYGDRGLDKFFAHLTVIYQSENVVIFERADP
jgi:uncharacterized membrane protein